MSNQKIENLLNLSLSATPEEREKSSVLEEGYNMSSNRWEIIIKYHGDISRYASEQIVIEELIAGYAIVTIDEELLEAFSRLDEVEYIEKPKRLIFSIENGLRESCIFQVTLRDPFLSGEGVLIAILDSGIDYYLSSFRTQSGNSKILYLWDQTLQNEAELGQNSATAISSGVEFTQQEINRALQQSSREAAYGIVPSRDVSGHGTAVAGIATSVAPESEFIIVKLGNPNPFSFPKTTELMRALKYVVEKAQFLGRPVSINISFGNTYGAHDGTSLLERYVDNISEIGRSAICVGSGNEGSGSGHNAGALSGTNPNRVELAIGEYETGISVQLWKNYNDIIRLRLSSPNQSILDIDLLTVGPQKYVVGGTTLLIYVGEPTPYSTDQEIFFDFIPTEVYLDSGIWTFELIPQRIVTGKYDFYLPSQTILNANTGFFEATPQITFTIPSTASKVITVGAYDSLSGSYADFSGRGYVVSLDGAGIVAAKPEIVAPGVSIRILQPGGQTRVVSGTSFATPFVTGSAALLMEWGIILGNDTYLYGEKVKAYLIRGARPFVGMSTPNPMTGWGALCVRDSLPL